MAKVVIIAPSDVDLTDAIKLLKGAGHDVDYEEPTPKTLLHIVLGLMGPNAYGFGPGYAYAPGPNAADDEDPLAPTNPDETATENDVTKGEGDLDNLEDTSIPADDFNSDDMEFNFESLTVDGNPVAAVKSDQEYTTLVVQELLIGPKTTYRLNESTFSFWPNDLAKPMQRVDVVHENKNVHTSLEVEVKRGEKTELLIGKDLLEILAPKKSVEPKQE